ncbi:MAG TPA: DUF362 domain-containing protein [Candidatus Binatia bacterium]|nr:DUF362 domain-containing protein [Candidatus Binatia bacterium]
MREGLTRRDWLVLSGLAAGAMAARPAEGAARPTSAGPAEPVSVAKVRSYDVDLTAQFRQMFDQIGGIDNQVKGKTVGIKVNLTGGGAFPGYTSGDTHWVHPRAVGAAVAAFGALGAKRIRILEGCESRKRGYKLEDKLLSGGWDVSAIRNAAPLVEFEETDTPGQAKQYSLLKVQSKPYVFPAFQVNHSYEDCDFFVSMGKMKNHEEMGLTLCIKNLFGITPLGVYSDREKVFHYGQVQSPSGVPAELDPKSNRYEGWRLPRVLADILGARPVDLAIADGIVSMVGGEGPWVLGSKPCHPGLLVVGRNCVNTDAVAAAVMGYNPRAGRHEAPYRVFKNPKDHPPEQCHPVDEAFQYADNMALLAEAAGLGSADLDKIDVRGVPVKEAMFEYEAFWKSQMPKEKS